MDPGIPTEPAAPRHRRPADPSRPPSTGRRPSAHGRACRPCRRVRSDSRAAPSPPPRCWLPRAPPRAPGCRVRRRAARLGSPARGRGPWRPSARVAACTHAPRRRWRTRLTSGCSSAHPSRT
eukprot:scaffold20628_cov65-Phaeocystis_antarctica.AAC.1